MVSAAVQHGRRRAAFAGARQVVLFTETPNRRSDSDLVRSAGGKRDFWNRRHKPLCKRDWSDSRSRSGSVIWLSQRRRSLVHAALAIPLEDFDATSLFKRGAVSLRESRTSRAPAGKGAIVSRLSRRLIGFLGFLPMSRQHGVIGCHARRLKMLPQHPVTRSAGSDRDRAFKTLLTFRGRSALVASLSTDGKMSPSLMAGRRGCLALLAPLFCAGTAAGDGAMVVRLTGRTMKTIDPISAVPQLTDLVALTFMPARPGRGIDDIELSCSMVPRAFALPCIEAIATMPSVHFARNRPALTCRCRGAQRSCRRLIRPCRTACARRTLGGMPTRARRNSAAVPADIYFGLLRLGRDNHLLLGETVVTPSCPIIPDLLFNGSGLGLLMARRGNHFTVRRCGEAGPASRPHVPE